MPSVVFRHITYMMKFIIDHLPVVYEIQCPFNFGVYDSFGSQRQAIRVVFSKNNVKIIFRAVLSSKCRGALTTMTGIPSDSRQIYA